MSYKLEIISLDPGANGSVFKQYNLDNKKIIGVDKKEPFLIRFKNESAENVEVCLSVDGTDVLTCEPASLYSSKRWFVKAFSVLEVKAWPETNVGGSEFVFGDSNKGVALNTHGNIEGVGVIAAAVYKENITVKYGPKYFNYYDFNNVWYGASANIGSSRFGSPGPILNNSIIRTQNLSKPAVGSGEFVKQAISTVKGLKIPVYSQTLTVHYEWWNDLHAKLKSAKESPNPFPAFKQNFDLNNVPKQTKKDLWSHYRT